MTDIQTRMREAMRAEAEQASADQLRPLRPLPEKVARRRAAARGWLVPAAAALAIVAVIALVTAGVHQAGIPAAGRSTAPTTGQPPWPTGDGSRPPYLVSVGYSQRIPGTTEFRMAFQVHSSVTGAVLYQLPLPGVSLATEGSPAIAAAGDGRHFVIEVPGGNRAEPAPRFMLLTIDANGRGTSLSGLSLRAEPAGMVVTDVALTADGTKLAIAWETIRPPAAGPTAELQVVSLASGATHSWTTRQEGERALSGMISEPSWGANDRLLAFEWDAATGPDRGLYLLNTSDPGAGLLSREIIPGSSDHRSIVDAYLTGPGRTVVATVVYPPAVANRKHPNWAVSAVVEYSVATGRIMRTIYGPGGNPTPMADRIVAIDPSGQYLLVTTNVLGRIDNGVFTMISRNSGLAGTAAW
jgi:hypothetical protein